MISDWIYPETDICFACGDLVEGLGRACFCDSCLAKLENVTEPLCKVCGKPIEDGAYCHWCGQYPREFLKAFSPYRYAGLARELILSCKYRNHPELARAMGGAMARYMIEHDQNKEIDWIVPVPIHKSRYRERGYNQACLMAVEIGKQLEIPVRKDWLLRREATRALKEMSAADRKESLKGVFEVAENAQKSIEMKRILLIDDVLTTGATAEACAAAIKQVVSGEIWVLTFATRG